MLRKLIAVVIILLLALVGIILWGPLQGCSQFRNMRTKIAERKTYDAATTGLTTSPSAAEDWPAWRGPRGDGISKETLPDKFPVGGPKQLWAADVGLGYSSPIAAAGRVYLFTWHDGHEALTAFDAITGHILWNDERPGGWDHSYPGARATPAIDGGLIYTYGGSGDLIARDLATGQPKWTINVLQTTSSENLGYGVASSPLIANGKIYVQSGSGGAIALAVEEGTGKTVWQSEARGVGGYAHPILIDVSGTPQLVVYGGDTIYGMDPDTGKTIWSNPWPTSYAVNSSTPVYADGSLFITSSYGQGCEMLQLAPAGATRLWAKREIQCKFQQTIVDGGALYANSAGVLKCMGWPDGNLKWKADRNSVPIGENGSIVRAGDKILGMSDSGTLLLVRATPEKYEALDKAEIFDAKEIWSTPLLYAGRLYVKGNKELVCLDVK